jgi:hypothetical protein
MAMATRGAGVAEGIAERAVVDFFIRPTIP